jgi:hypothetical protein
MNKEEILKTLQEKLHENMIYDLVIKDYGIIIKNKPLIIKDLVELKKYDFKFSTITKCLINDKEINKNKYTPILMHIYNIIDDGTTIIKNTSLNIKTIKKDDMGFCYIENLGISVQNVEANKAIHEICNQCDKNNVTVNMTITLASGQIVNVIF